MQNTLRHCRATLWIGWALVLPIGVANAQTVQLPTITGFNVQTTVIVPDGGTMLLGSVNRSSMGSTSRGVPLLSNIPGAGRLFRNRGIGQETSSGTATVSAQIISLRELEPAVLAEGERRLQAAVGTTDPQTQRQAEFLSRNIGRTIGR
jgi:type II secretory pathway component GspD/PulD (secretin)